MRREEIADVAGSEVVSLCVVSLSEKTVDFRYFRHFRTFQWELAATQEPQGAPTQRSAREPHIARKAGEPTQQQVPFLSELWLFPWTSAQQCFDTAVFAHIPRGRGAVDGKTKAACSDL